ncbi:MAG: TonB-dependent receptor, partial [Bacteroidales bacterium]|nr:TonB-dependent receptor [Bacteroidales bacterium]
EGQYTLNIEPGIYTLEISSVGFEKTQYRVKIISNGEFDMELFKDQIEIGEVAVFAQRKDQNVSGNQMSMVTLDPRSIDELPTATGEKDIIKSLTSMPGIKTIGEFGSGIHVRGGGEDQNLYLLEGAPLYNTSHAFGLLSSVNPDAVQGVSLYKGHIPAQYGERVSSVMDIRMNKNNIEEFRGAGGIGIYNSRLMLETPLYEENLSLRMGGRANYSDWLLDQIEDYYLNKSSASFYDANGLLNWKFKNNRITLFGYLSHDRFRYASKLNYEYGNHLGSLKWSHVFNSNFHSRFETSFSRYDVTKSNIDPENNPNRIKSQVNYMSGKYNLQYTGFSKHTINTGIQGIYHSIKPGKQTPLKGNSNRKSKTLMNEQAYEGAVYINDNFEINNQISVNLGLRYSGYQYTGAHTIYKYQDGKPLSRVYRKDSITYGKGEGIQYYDGLDPRLSLRYRLTPTQSVKVSYNRNHQYISLLSHTSISTPEDTWKLSDPHLKPISANQYAAGYFRNFNNNNIETSVELYYKQLNHLIEYKNDAQIEMNPHIETELIDARGKNYGVELSVKKKSGKLNGWISYTYSRTFKKTDGGHRQEIISQNNYFPSAYDKPHDLNVVANYNIDRRWKLSANFMLASGRAVTLPEYEYPVGNNKIIYFSDRNKYRLPAYHRLDFSLTYGGSLRKDKKWKSSLTLSILNLYGRNNAYSVFYKKNEPDAANDYNMFALYKMYIIGRPFPTLTYNFTF